MKEKNIYVACCRIYDPGFWRIAGIILGIVYGSACIAGLVIVVVKLFTAPISEGIILISGMAAIIWMPIYFYKYGTSCELTLTESMLIIKTWKYGFSFALKNDLISLISQIGFPKTVTHELEVNDLKTIIYAQIPYIKKYAEEVGDSSLINRLQEFGKYLTHADVGSKIVLPSLKYVYVLDKNGCSYVASRGSIPDKKISYLFELLEQRGVQTIIQ